MIDIKIHLLVGKEWMGARISWVHEVLREWEQEEEKERRQRREAKGEVEGERRSKKEKGKGERVTEKKTEKLLRWSLCKFPTLE